MELVGMILGCLILTWGGVRATNAATGKAKRLVATSKAATKTRQAAREKARATRRALPDPAPAPRAVAAGTVAAGLVFGAALYAAAGKAGWKAGWADGRDRVIDWWERRQARAEVAATPPAPAVPPTAKYSPKAAQPVTPPSPPVPPAPATAPPPAAPPAPPVPAPQPGGEQAPRPRLSVVPNNPSAGGNSMAVHTMTGGEVTNVESGQSEAQAALVRATTEFEDATADLARAQEEVKVNELFKTSTARLKFPAPVTDLTAQQAEVGAARVDAAQRRLAAAEAAKNVATQLLREMTAHLELATAAAARGGLASAEAYGGR